MNRLVLESGIAELGLGGASACILRGLQLPGEPRVLDQEVAALEAWAADLAEEDIARAGAPYRKVLSALGYPDVVPAGERLVRLVRERGLRRHGPLIDACNLVSARHFAGIGLHEASLLGQHDVIVRFASGEESLTPIYKSKPVHVPAGDLVYGHQAHWGLETMAWLGAKDVDSDRWRLRESTDEVLVVALGHPGSGRQQTEAMCEEFAEHVRAAHPGVAAEFLKG